MKLIGKLPEFLNFYILILAILAGQLIKIPLGLGGITLLDLTISGFCLIGIWKVRDKLTNLPKVIRAGLFFFLVALLSLLVTPLDLALNEYLSAAFYLIRFLLYLLFGFLVYQNLFPSLRSKSSELLTFSGAGLAIIGLLQLTFFPNLSFLESSGWDPHYFRTVSTFLDPNFIGAFFILTLLLLYQDKLQFKWGKIFAGLVFLALLTTFSRSSYLMFLVSFSILSYLKHSWKLALVTGVTSLTLIASFYLYTSVISKPRGIDREASASFRLSTWQQGLELFRSSPVLGVGFNTYKYALREYRLVDQQFLNSRGATSNDSSLLFVLATTGLLGFAAFLHFLYMMILENRVNFVLTAALSGLVVHSFFANSLFYPFILLWLLLVCLSKTTKNSVK